LQEKSVDFKGIMERASEVLGRKESYYIAIALIFVIGAVQIYSSYALAITADTYRSDEVWYVSSARNILNEVFKTNVSYNYQGYMVFTVFTYDYSTLIKIKELVIERNGIIVKDDYTKTNAIAIGVKDVSVLEEIQQLRGVKKIISGFPYPDAANIDAYLNFEHPPLAKYIIGLSMKICGDSPICWRMPSIISSGLTIVLVGLVSIKLFGPLGGVLSALIGLLDPLSTNMGSVAMLDIYLALFTALGLLFLSKKKYLLASVAFSLAFNVKYSALFLLIGLYIYLRFKDKSILRNLYIIAIPFLLVTSLIYLPFILNFGIERVLSELKGALIWHTTSRPPGPATSNPIDWVLGFNSFYLSVQPEILARGYPWIYVPAFAGMLLLLPSFSGLYRYKINDVLKATALLGILFFAEYFFVMMLGNRTLYSFYFVNFSPIGYIMFVKFLDLLFINQQQLDESLSMYKQWFTLLLKGETSWILIPKELKLIIPASFFERKYRKTTLMLIILLILSLFMHLSTTASFRLYTDSSYILHEAPINEPGRIMGMQGLLIILLKNIGASENLLVLLDVFFGYLLINELLILARKATSERNKKLVFATYPFLLSILFYTGYDGSTISLFFFVLSINLILEGRKGIGYLTLGLSSGNPMIFLVNSLIAIIAELKYTAIYFATIASLFLSIPLLLRVPFYNYINDISLFYVAQKTATYYSFFGVESVFLIGTAITLLLAWFIINKYQIAGLLDRIGIILLVFVFLYPNMLPQWSVFLIVLSIMLSKRFLGRVMIIDLLNALFIVTWFSNSYLMQALFKYTSSTPLQAYSLPTLIYLFRAAVALTILLSLLDKAKIGVRDAS
jgi:predicted membrane-bound dolichyl-phosphate-mannose-protein mannosyltransferase